MTKRILIIDDEDDIRDVVQVSLEAFGGWETLTAASGLEGLQLAQTAKPDAILLDITMPDMDGLQVYRALQTEPTTQAIPVIILTAKVLPRDRQQFVTLDVTGIITKPFDPLTIWRQVAEILHWRI